MLMADTGTHALGGDGPLILSVLWPLNALATIIILARWYASGRLTGALDWGLAWATLACVSPHGIIIPHMLLSNPL